MNNQRLISFDIQADFGFFKKPDYNDGVLLSYNISVSYTHLRAHET